MLKPDERRSKELGEGILATLRGVHEDLQSLGKVIGQTTGDQQRSGREAEENIRKGHSLQQSNLTVQKLLCAFTFCAFVAAAIYAWVADGQRDIMNKQLGKMTESIDLMRTQNGLLSQQTDLITKQIKGSQAARVDFTIYLQQTEPLGLSVGATNYGHVIATNIGGSITLNRLSLPSKEPMGKLTLYPIKIPDLGPIPEPGPSIRIGNSNSYNHLYPISGWSRSSYAELRDQTATVTLTGSLKYSNGFGDVVPYDICLTFLRDANAFVTCSDFETAMNNAPK
jgi:hypothetical protein